MARLGRGFPNNRWLRLRRLSQAYLSSQPTFVTTSASSIGQQPLYVGGPALPLAGSIPSFAYGLATLSGQQAAHAKVNTIFLQSTPMYAAGAAQAFLASQPAYGVVRSSLTGAQPAYGAVRQRTISSQPAYAPVGAIQNTQGMMVRGFPDLTVTPNVIRQQYAPVQVVEITVGSEAQYGEAQYGETQYGGN